MWKCEQWKLMDKVRKCSSLCVGNSINAVIAVSAFSSGFGLSNCTDLHFTALSLSLPLLSSLIHVPGVPVNLGIARKSQAFPLRGFDLSEPFPPSNLKLSCHVWQKCWPKIFLSHSTDAAWVVPAWSFLYNSHPQIWVNAAIYWAYIPLTPHLPHCALNLFPLMICILERQTAYL